MISDYIKKLRKTLLLSPGRKSLRRLLSVLGENRAYMKAFLIGFSLFASVMIWWFAARDGEINITRSVTVPIYYSNLLRGYSMHNESKNIEVVFTGSSNKIANLTEAEVSAHVDLQGLHPGTYNLPIQITSPSYVMAKRWKPSSVEVKIYRYIERSMPVIWTLKGELPEGLAVASVDVVPAAATIGGAEDSVLAVRSLRVSVPIDRTVSGINDINVDILQEGVDKPDNSLTISPKQARVLVTLEEEVRGERLPVKVSIVGEPAPGLEVADVKIMPEAVSVRGLRSLVKGLNAVVMPPLDITGLDQDLSVTLPLHSEELPQGVEIEGTDKVKVEIKLQDKMVHKTLNGVGITVAGVEGEKEWTMMPQTVDVTIEGSSFAVEPFYSGNTPFDLYVDVSDIVAGRVTLPVLVRNMRGNVKITRIEPEYITLTTVK